MARYNVYTTHGIEEVTADMHVWAQVALIFKAKEEKKESVIQLSTDDDSKELYAFPYNNLVKIEFLGE